MIPTNTTPSPLRVTRLAAASCLLALALTSAATAQDGDEEEGEGGRERYQHPGAEWVETLLGFLRERYDADGDGKVARAEYQRDDEHWKRMDRDADGFVTAVDWEKPPPDKRLREPIRAPGKGSLAPRFNLTEVRAEPETPPADLAGAGPKSWSVESLIEVQPALFFFANNTAPQARRLAEQVRRLHGLYGEGLHFVVVACPELHPIDGPVPPEPNMGVPLLEEALTREERVEQAQRLIRELGLQDMTVLLDHDGLQSRVYRGKSGRLYLVHKSSRVIAFRGESGKIGEQMRELEDRIRTMLDLDPLPRQR
jgi:hypothetical protein